MVVHSTELKLDRFRNAALPAEPKVYRFLKSARSSRPTLAVIKVQRLKYLNFEIGGYQESAPSLIGLQYDVTDPTWHFQYINETDEQNNIK